MQRLEHLLTAIENDLGGNEAAKACSVLVKYIASRKHNADLILSFGNIAEILSARSDSEVLYTTIAILSNERVGVLKPEIHLLTDEGVEPIPADLLEAYFEKGELADPNTGELLENPDSHIVPLFHASPDWLNEDVPA